MRTISWLSFVPMAALVLFTPNAKSKKTKAPSSDPKGEIAVVAHIPSTRGTVTRFLMTQHYSSNYLYAEHSSGNNLTLIDVTQASRPSVLANVSYAPNGGQDSLAAVAGTAALVTNEAPESAAAPVPQTISIMDFSDPAHPKVAREFTGVTAMTRDDKRGLVFLANTDGIWILQEHLAEDPAVEKAYQDYLFYGSR